MEQLLECGGFLGEWTLEGGYQLPDVLGGPTDDLETTGPPSVCSLGDPDGGFVSGSSVAVWFGCHGVWPFHCLMGLPLGLSAYPPVHSTVPWRTALRSNAPKARRSWGSSVPWRASRSRAALASAWSILRWASCRAWMFRCLWDSRPGMAGWSIIGFSLSWVVVGAVLVRCK